MSTEKLICVSDGFKIFVGHLAWPSEDKLGEAIKDGHPVTLKNARVIREVTVPTPQGLAASVHVMPHAMCRGGITLDVVVASLFWPEGDDEKKIRELLAACEADEVKHRAADSGIITANPDGLRGMR